MEVLYSLNSGSSTTLTGSHLVKEESSMHGVEVLSQEQFYSAVQMSQSDVEFQNTRSTSVVDKISINAEAMEQCYVQSSERR